jgi:broad specificity phosphatase PhoE
MSIELIFETHSTTEDNEKGLGTGWNPGVLSAAGREQAQELGRRRATDDIDAIFTSDLGRAVETVRIAFPSPTVPVLMDWRLRECDYGDLNGTAAALSERAQYVDKPYPSGESWRQAVDRVGWFLRDFEPRWRGSRLLVVGHGATLRGLEHHINGKPLESIGSAPFEWQEGWEFRVG